MDHRDELLKKSWEGEVLGESFFAALTDVLPDDRAMWDLLTALESTMGGLVETVAVQHGIQIDSEALTASGKSFAEASPEGGRDILFGELLKVVSEFLEVYQELTGLLADDEAWLGSELVAHEQALAYYVEHELAGKGGGEAKVVEFLTRHGSEIPASA